VKRMRRFRKDVFCFIIPSISYGDLCGPKGAQPQHGAPSSLLTLKVKPPIFSSAKGKSCYDPEDSAVGTKRIRA
jgi:hypothetical protein